LKIPLLEGKGGISDSRGKIKNFFRPGKHPRGVWGRGGGGLAALLSERGVSKESQGIRGMCPSSLNEQRSEKPRKAVLEHPNSPVLFGGH